MGEYAIHGVFRSVRELAVFNEDRAHRVQGGFNTMARLVIVNFVVTNLQTTEDSQTRTDPRDVEEGESGGNLSSRVFWVLLGFAWLFALGIDFQVGPLIYTLRSQTL